MGITPHKARYASQSYLTRNRFSSRCAATTGRDGPTCDVMRFWQRWGERPREPKQEPLGCWPLAKERPAGTSALLPQVFHTPLPHKYRPKGNCNSCTASVVSNACLVEALPLAALADAIGIFGLRKHVMTVNICLCRWLKFKVPRPSCLIASEPHWLHGF
jgi:hypothetical protein